MTATPQALVSESRHFKRRVIVLLLVVIALSCGAAYIWFRLHPVNRFVRVDLKALGNFPLDAHEGTQNDIPSRWRNLDGKRVEVAGYMLSPYQPAQGTTAFQIVYKLSSGLSGAPLVQERVFATAPDAVVRARSEDTNHGDLLVFSGMLHVKVTKGDDYIESVFKMDVEQINRQGRDGVQN